MSEKTDGASYLYLWILICDTFPIQEVDFCDLKKEV